MQKYLKKNKTKQILHISVKKFVKLIHAAWYSLSLSLSTSYSHTHKLEILGSILFIIN